MNVPNALQIKRINLNDDIKIDINYTKSPDECYFSLVLIYQMDVVATSRFHFNEMLIKLWDVYSNFTLGDSSLRIRISMYDPAYFMPS